MGLGDTTYALRRPGDGGIGDALALEHCVTQAANQGADAVAISPTHAMFSADPERYSPYSPSTRLLYNVLYSAAENLFGEARVDEAQARNGLQAELRRLEANDFLDWPEAARAKLSWLRYLYDDFMGREDNAAQALRQEMQAFRRAGATYWKIIAASKPYREKSGPATGVNGQPNFAIQPAPSLPALPRRVPTK